MYPEELDFSALREDVPWLAPLTNDELTILFQRAIHKQFPRRSAIIQAGDIGDSLYLLIKGKVKITLVSDSGEESVIGIHAPYKAFGEMALLDDGKRSATVTALERCELLEIRRADFQKFLASHPQVSIRMLGYLSKLLREANAHMQALQFDPLPRRLAKALLWLAEDHGHTLPGGGVRIMTGLGQEDIGSFVGARRESINRLFRDWRDEGVLSFQADAILLHRLEFLLGVASAEG